MKKYLFSSLALLTISAMSVTPNTSFTIKTTMPNPPATGFLWYKTTDGTTWSALGTTAGVSIQDQLPSGVGAQYKVQGFIIVNNIQILGPMSDPSDPIVSGTLPGACSKPVVTQP